MKIYNRSGDGWHMEMEYCGTDMKKTRGFVGKKKYAKKKAGFTGSRTAREK